MTLEIKFLSDIIGSIERVWNGIKSIAKISEEERAKYRSVFIDTLDLMDHAILLIHTRLGDILGIIDDNDLPKTQRELSRLDDFHEWLEIERAVRLCRNLRIQRREMNSIINKFRKKISIKDLNELDNNLDKIFTAEKELAEYISFFLQELAKLRNESDLKKILITNFKKKLREERLNLIDLEKKIIEKVI